MKSFNLKKNAAKNDYTTHNKMLEERNKEMGLSPPDVNTEVNLKNNNRKDKDNTLLYEGQMDEVRKGTKPIITEGGLETGEKVYNDKRLDVWDTPINHVTNVVSEKADQEKLKAFKEAENEDKRDTSFWDKYVGVQLDGKATKIVNNVQKSQLPNHPDRFNGDQIDEMVMASLKDADAMLFHIYATANEQNRDLDKNEIKTIANINEGKKEILAQVLTDEVSNVSIRQERDGRFTVNENGLPIVDMNGIPAEFDSYNDAKQEYPEAEDPEGYGTKGGGYDVGGVGDRFDYPSFG